MRHVNGALCKKRSIASPQSGRVGSKWVQLPGLSWIENAMQRNQTQYSKLPECDT